MERAPLDAVHPAPVTPAPIAAVIFDMDGLMLDTERLARAAWERAFAERGLRIDDAVYYRVIGRTSPDTRRIFGEAYALAPDVVEDIARRKTAFLLASYERDIPVKPGLIELLAWLDARGVPRAVATSTLRELALHKLGKAGLAGGFRAIVCGDDVARGKPAPDIFLLAAHRLGARPEACAVLEDSEPGIRAARAAGMRAILVPDQAPPAPEAAALAHHVCASLADARDVLVLTPDA